MSAITTGTSPTAAADRQRSRQAVVPVAIACLLLTTFLNVSRSDTAAEAIAMVALDAAVLGLVFVFVVVRGLRQESAGGRALALGVTGALLALPAFWSGLPIILGAAALLLGHAGRRATNGSAQAMAGFALGALAVVGYVAFYVSDWIAHPGCQLVVLAPPRVGRPQSRCSCQLRPASSSACSTCRRSTSRSKPSGSSRSVVGTSSARAVATSAASYASRLSPLFGRRDVRPRHPRRRAEAAQVGGELLERWPGRADRRRVEQVQPAAQRHEKLVDEVQPHEDGHHQHGGEGQPDELEESDEDPRVHEVTLGRNRRGDKAGNQRGRIPAESGSRGHGQTPRPSLDSLGDRNAARGAHQPAPVVGRSGDDGRARSRLPASVPRPALCWSRSRTSSAGPGRPRRGRSAST